jgi:hypothetical protein
LKCFNVFCMTEFNRIRWCMRTPQSVGFWNEWLPSWMLMVEIGSWTRDLCYYPIIQNNFLSNPWAVLKWRLVSLHLSILEVNRIVFQNLFIMWQFFYKLQIISNIFTKKSVNIFISLFTLFNPHHMFSFRKAWSF